MSKYKKELVRIFFFLVPVLIFVIISAIAAFWYYHSITKEIEKTNINNIQTDIKK